MQFQQTEKVGPAKIIFVARQGVRVTELRFAIEFCRVQRLAKFAPRGGRFRRTHDVGSVSRNDVGQGRIEGQERNLRWVRRALPKDQTPNTKSQTNTKSQAPSQQTPFAVLGF